jgi:hypothetical protein
VLEWRLTPPDVGYGGLVPSLIDWRCTPHATTRALPETELIELRATAADPSSVRPALAALRVELRLDIAESVALVAVVQGVDGPVEI